MCIKQSSVSEQLWNETIQGCTERFIGAVQQFCARELFYSPAKPFQDSCTIPSFILLHSFLYNGIERSTLWAFCKRNVNSILSDTILLLYSLSMTVLNPLVMSLSVKLTIANPNPCLLGEFCCNNVYTNAIVILSNYRRIQCIFGTLLIWCAALYGAATILPDQCLGCCFTYVPMNHSCLASGVLTAWISGVTPRAYIAITKGSPWLSLQLQRVLHPSSRCWQGPRHYVVYLQNSDR